MIIPIDIQNGADIAADVKPFIIQKDAFLLLTVISNGNVTLD